MTTSYTFLRDDATFAGGSQMAGTTNSPTTDDAVAGNIGEYKSSLVPFIFTVPANMVLLSSPSFAWYNITSLSLTAGDWNVTGFGAFNQDGIGNTGGSTVVGILASAISSISANPNDYSCFGEFAGNNQNIFLSANIPTIPLPIKRFSLASTTTVYLMNYAAVSGGSCYGGGFISARRAR